jgi:hypothetical protein
MNRTPRHTVIAFAAVLLAPLAALNATEPLQLRPRVPVVVDPAEPRPVLRAVEDLRRDLQWVLGSPSPRLDRLPADSATPAIVVTREGTGTEAHSISVSGNHIVLQGADMRGVIYAIYSFSDRFLDVPPWWFSAKWKPIRRLAVEVPGDTNLRWQSPQVAWRAWFPNDTDLLTPWIQKDYDAQWNLLVETMLRLKLNMVDVGELSEKATRKAEIPRDRGNGHHHDAHGALWRVSPELGQVLDCPWKVAASTAPGECRCLGAILGSAHTAGAARKVGDALDDRLSW